VLEEEGVLTVEKEDGKEYGERFLLVEADVGKTGAALYVGGWVNEEETEVVRRGEESGSVCWKLRVKLEAVVGR
jgi:hypothetical protein